MLRKLKLELQALRKKKRLQDALREELSLDDIGSDLESDEVEYERMTELQNPQYYQNKTGELGLSVQRSSTSFSYSNHRFNKSMNTMMYSDPNTAKR